MATKKKAVHAHLEEEDHDRFNDLCDLHGVTMTSAVQALADMAEDMPEEFWKRARKWKSARLSRKGTNATSPA